VAHDCITPAGGEAIDIFKPAGDAMPDEGEPAFYPARDRPPVTESGRLEQVTDENGALVGWLHYAAAQPVEGGRATTDPVAVYEQIWRLQDIEGIGTIEGIDTTIQFNPLGTVSGNGACNRFSGNADLGEGTIKVGPVASTQMACADPIDNQEMRFHDALSRAQAWQLENGALSFLAADGAPLLRFVVAE
jgi:heat shock protein HslJ